MSKKDYDNRKEYELDFGSAIDNMIADAIIEERLKMIQKNELSPMCGGAIGKDCRCGHPHIRDDNKK